jgi:hypothetical protein
MQAGQRGTLLRDQPRPGQGQGNPSWRGALCSSLAMEGTLLCDDHAFCAPAGDDGRTAAALESRALQDC